MALIVSREQIRCKYGVYILDQAMACQLKAPEHSTLIRIKGKNPTGYDMFFPLAHPDSFAEVHLFEFDDIASRIEDHNAMFDSEMAIRVVNAFEKYSETKNKYPDALFVVHCQAGISRSSAVGLGYAYFIQNTDLEKAISTAGFTPNARVYRLLVEEIQRRQQFMKVRDLRKAMEDMPDYASVKLLVETSYSQQEQPATAVIKDEHALTLTHELVFLNMSETRFRDYFDKEQLGFFFFQNQVEAGDALQSYLAKIRKDWSEQYKMPMPVACKLCAYTLIPERAACYEPGYSFYKWRCTKEKCEQNEDDLITKLCVGHE